MVARRAGDARRRLRRRRPRAGSRYDGGHDRIDDRGRRLQPRRARAHARQRPTGPDAGDAGRRSTGAHRRPPRRRGDAVRGDRGVQRRLGRAGPRADRARLEGPDLEHPPLAAGSRPRVGQPRARRGVRALHDRPPPDRCRRLLGRRHLRAVARRLERRSLPGRDRVLARAGSSRASSGASRASSSRTARSTASFRSAARETRSSASSAGPATRSPTAASAATTRSRRPSRQPPSAGSSPARPASLRERS